MAVSDADVPGVRIAKEEGEEIDALPIASYPKLLPPYPAIEVIEIVEEDEVEVVFAYCGTYEKMSVPFAAGYMPVDPAVPTDMEVTRPDKNTPDEAARESLASY